MPAVAPLVEFNRNQSKVIDELQKSGEPLYLTKNGKASVVVMDAAAFDRIMENREQIRDLEQSVYKDLMRGYQDVLEEKVLTLEEADEKIRAAKGW